MNKIKDKAEMFKILIKVSDFVLSLNFIWLMEAWQSE